MVADVPATVVFCLRMAVRTNQPQISFLIMSRMTIDVIHLERNGFSHPLRVSTNLATMTSFCDQASFLVARISVLFKCLHEKSIVSNAAGILPLDDETPFGIPVGFEPTSPAGWSTGFEPVSSESHSEILVH